MAPAGWGAFGGCLIVAASGPIDVLYFAAGPNDEGDGRFGKIAPVK
jgi:hypothetical protein